jgi:hypothetical protein
VIRLGAAQVLSLEMVIAHAGHWLVSVAYFVPVVGLLVWLAVTQYRERVRERRR